MPELPEVEVMRRRIESHVLNTRLQTIEAVDGRLVSKLPTNWPKLLEGNAFSSSQRVGKYLFLNFDKTWLHLHFGMTGSVSFVSKDETPPPYTRLKLAFDNGLMMCFTDPRTFGKMDIVNRVEAFVANKRLGVDLLEASDEDAIRMFANRKISLKAILLRQKDVAGIGNWLADEALYRLKLNPTIRGIDLTPEVAIALLNETKSIAEEAIQADTHYGEFPNHFFVNHRVEDGDCPCTKDTIKKITLAGRSTYYCPTCQPQTK
ncbi:MAG: hypothetical protein LAT54_06080 [Cryomorphaceae bacterium]|nr:hypothetical protein [Cryomorphaceae bacterium]